MDKWRVLLVADTTSLNTSGGKVIHYLSKLLRSNGHLVKIVDLSEAPCTVGYYETDTLFSFPQRFSGILSFLNFLYLVRFKREYKTLLKSFRPQIVHFASFDSGKPLWYIKASYLKGRKIILQPWIYDFYCAKKYGFRNGKDCSLCLNNSFGSALKYNCISIFRVLELYRRSNLKNAEKYADYFLSSTVAMDQKLHAFGVPGDKIRRLPVPFERVDYDGINISGDYFIFFGQSLDPKGLKFIINFFNKHSQYKLKVFTLGKINYEHRENIEINTNISWNNGLIKEIRNCMAIILPSLWQTTGEYALFESMSFKKPIILFKVGIHAELFEVSQSAHLVNLSDENAFLTGIERVASDASYRQNLGSKAYEQINYQIDSFYTKLSSIYYD
jgi:glycosyltransferase involved in cell wall biosynthesis